MTVNKIVLSDDTLNAMSTANKRINVLKDGAKEANGEAQTLKLGNYCQLIAGVASEPMQKGNFKNSAIIRGELQNFVGLSESMVETQYSRCSCPPPHEVPLSYGQRLHFRESLPLLLNLRKTCR